MNDTDSNPGRRRLVSRIKLILIILLFAGPLFVAFLSYYGNGLDFSFRGQSNNAPLVTPAVALEDFSNETLAGERANRDTLGRKWTIVHVVSGQCDDACKQALYQTRQTRLAVGKDIKRIQRYIVVREWDAVGSSADPNSLVGQIQTNHPDALVLKASESGIENQVAAQLAVLESGKYDAVLIDPLGNLMMIVPLDLDPRLLLKDLKKLLKLSRIG